VFDLTHCATYRYFVEMLPLYGFLCEVLSVAVGPMSWNSLPNSLRQSACDDNISDDCFKHSLKTFLFGGYRRTERSRGVHDSALYKSTFTYLLTYLLRFSVLIFIQHGEAKKGYDDIIISRYAYAYAYVV